MPNIYHIKLNLDFNFMIYVQLCKYKFIFMSPGSSYKSPGYGTQFGTSFPGGVGKYGTSGKMLGLGVGAGFLGGAAVGAVGGLAALSVYHRY